ncbi:MAG: xanthine dehydrogenase family protein molybdopterin-binding subunit [Chloroflexia bacterium]|nr:xanthine dehydrogenase family protein molybdopterin-binding subunit [Chloroflexia bacterium]
MVMSKMVGARVRRKEDPRLITGSSTYVDDVKLPGILHAAFVRSPYPHGVLNGVDASAAEAASGVIAVITGDNLGEYLASMDTTARGEDTGEENTGETEEEVAGAIHVPAIRPLAIGKVRFVGEAVAMVIAETRAQAVDATELVELDIDPLEAVTDVFAAMEAGSPLVYDEVPNNIGAVVGGKRGGDVEAAFASAPFTTSARIRSQRLSAVPIEPRAVLATVDPITQGLTFWTSTQAPHWNRNEIAEAIGLKQNQVRCIAPEVGGGFGQKIGAYAEDFLVSGAAYKLKRPVKWIETRSENFLGSAHGRNQWADIEAAADETGKILALRARVTSDAGALPKGLGLASSTWTMSTGCYDIPALDYVCTTVYTNTGANHAYRGAGRPEAAYYIERIADLVADVTGLDPVDVRRVNFIRPEAFPFDTLTGAQYDSGDYEKPLDKAIEVVEYAALRQEQADGRAQGRYIGIGFASYVEICGFGPYESSTVRVEPSGAVTIFTGISPHGQGQETTFAQLASDNIGADFGDVVVQHGDTGNTPQGNGTMGSRGLAVGGAAVMLSLDKVREKAKQIAAHLLEASAEDIELEDGVYRVAGVPTRSVTLADIAEAAYGGGLPSEFDAGLESTDFFRPAGTTFPFGTHIAVVEVFPETGDVEILRYVAVDDCGKIISPMLVTGQVHGGLAQGIGQALFEEVHYDESGELITGTLNDYVVPRAHHFPEFESYHTETPTYLNPMGAKGIGEAATIGATPATVNAVIDALEPWGITHLNTPFTPNRIWSAIQESGVTASAAD